jgi:hypothetical protein
MTKIFVIFALLFSVFSTALPQTANAQATTPKDDCAVFWQTLPPTWWSDTLSLLNTKQRSISTDPNVSLVLAKVSNSNALYDGYHLIYMNVGSGATIANGTTSILSHFDPNFGRPLWAVYYNPDGSIDPLKWFQTGNVYTNYTWGNLDCVVAKYNVATPNPIYTFKDIFPFNNNAAYSPLTFTQTAYVAPPPPSCPDGYTGTYPDCIAPVAPPPPPPGGTGTPSTPTVQPYHAQIIGVGLAIALSLVITSQFRYRGNT